LDCHISASTAALTNASYPDSDINRRGVIGPDPDEGGDRGAITLKNVFDLQMLILVRRDEVAPRKQYLTPSCCPYLLKFTSRISAVQCCCTLSTLMCYLSSCIAQPFVFQT
jgi:hypothetical protein